MDDAAVDGNDASNFKILNRSSIADTLGVGESVEVQINYTASKVGIQSAILRLKTNDTSNPIIDVPLRGVGTAGTGVAGIWWIVDLFLIPGMVRSANAWRRAGGAGRY